MEIILWIIGIFLLLGIIQIVIESIQNALSSINWKLLIFGGVGLAILFSFTAEGILVIIGAYIALIIFSFISGMFDKKIRSKNELY